MSRVQVVFWALNPRRQAHPSYLKTSKKPLHWALSKSFVPYCLMLETRFGSLAERISAACWGCCPRAAAVLAISKACKDLKDPFKRAEVQSLRQKTKEDQAFTSSETTPLSSIASLQGNVFDTSTSNMTVGFGGLQKISSLGRVVIASLKFRQVPMFVVQC